jgi:histidinol-phosphate aminotransferase
MDKHLVKVAPHILDLPDMGEESQEALFALPGEPCLKLDRNEATIAPSPAVEECLRQCINSQSLQYEPDLSSRRLRRKLSRYTGVGFDNITCFSSKPVAFETLCRTYLADGSEAVISSPNDSAFGHIAIGSGAKVVNTLYSDIFTPSVDQIISNIGPKTRLVYINNPNSPTGALFSEAEIVFLLSYLENSMVVIDESYFEFCGVSMVDLIKKFSNLAVVRTFSKAFALGGLDAAYLLTDSSNARFINRLAWYNGPSIMAQVAAEAALDDINFATDYVRKVNRSKRMLFDSLLRMGYDCRVTAANFILLSVKDNVAMVSALAKSNIYVKALINMAGLENTIQMTIGTPEQTEIVLDILGRLAKDQATQLGQGVSRIRKIEKPKETAELVAVS